MTNPSMRGIHRSNAQREPRAQTHSARTDHRKSLREGVTAKLGLPANASNADIFAAFDAKTAKTPADREADALYAKVYG